VPGPYVSTSHSSVEALRLKLESIRQLTLDHNLELVSLGHEMEELIRIALQITEASGRTSMRYSAAVRALTLTTPKSEILAFLGTQPTSSSEER